MQEPLIDPKKTALILGHFQKDLLCAGDPPYNELARLAREAGVVQNAANVAAGMRRAGISVMLIKVNDRTEFIKRGTRLITDAALVGMPSVGRGKEMIEGTPGAEIVDELRPTPQDYVTINYGKSAFNGSSLEVVLRRLGVDTLVVGGISTQMFVESTVRDATDRGFNVIVLSDCCISRTQETHEYPIKKVFPRLCRIRTSDQVLKLINK